MNNSNQKSYSVIIPTYKSSEKIFELCSEIIDVFNTRDLDFEIIIINDGGNKENWYEIKKIYDQIDCKICLIRLSKNYGQHNATLCGISNAKGDFIVTIDDDKQVQTSDILKLIEVQNEGGFELVYGVYDSKKHGILRNIGSGMIKRMSKLFYNTKGKGSSFRLFSKFIAQNILNHGQSFIYIDELLMWYTDNISFVKVAHYKSKKSRYSFLSLVKMTFNISTNYTALPLKFITYLGLISSFVTFILGLYFLYRKLFKDVPLGYTSVIVSVLFSASLILFSLGILGQYIYKLYQVQNKKPSFSVKQKLSK